MNGISSDQEVATNFYILILNVTAGITSEHIFLPFPIFYPRLDYGRGDWKRK